MQDAIAQLVYPVLSYGLRLQERMDQGEQADLDQEQAILKEMLLTDRAARQWLDYGGETVSRTDHDEVFLGIRYALVCWLDELFTSSAAWGGRWNEQKLEVELYGTNDRAWKFWRQAELAQSRAGTDAVEAFFLCVALGFRGELRERPDRLARWLATTARQLGRVPELDFGAIAELAPAPNVPPLLGRDRLQRMVVTGWIVLMVLIPVAAFMLVDRLSQ
jgi:type VI secretion system protein ImpK